jgi:hypothetical protein
MRIFIFADLVEGSPATPFATLRRVLESAVGDQETRAKGGRRWMEHTSAASMLGFVRETARAHVVHTRSINRGHVHMLLSIPLSPSVSHPVQHLKGRSSQELL